MNNQDKATHAPIFVGEDFGDFCAVRVHAPQLEVADISQLQSEIAHLLSAQSKMLIADLVEVKHCPEPVLLGLSNLVSELKNQWPELEVVISADPTVAERIQSSPMATQVGLYLHEDHQYRLMRLQQVLINEDATLIDEMNVQLHQAIEAALSSWTIEIEEIQKASLVAPQLDDKDIVYHLDVKFEGRDFELYLAISEASLCSILSRSLRRELTALDPQLADGAGEILNYISASLRFLVTNRELYIESGPPHLLPAEQRQAIHWALLNHLEVHTKDGLIRVWLTP